MSVSDDTSGPSDLSLRTRVPLPGDSPTDAWDPGSRFRGTAPPTPGIPGPTSGAQPRWMPGIPATPGLLQARTCFGSHAWTLAALWQLSKWGCG